MDTLEKVLPRTIFLTVAGSHLYGTNVPSSDYDFKGVCIPTADYFFGLKNFEQLERQVNKGHPHDLTIFSLRKFVTLAADCNPNIIELLFADEQSIVHLTPAGEALLSIRDKFLSRNARHRFAGYAHSQLSKIKRHRGWLLNPPKEKPTRKMFGLSETSKVTASELGAFESLLRDGLEDVELPKDVVTLFVKERQYQAALTVWNQYERWQRERNEARHALEAKYGYDTKHAMHLVRLMRMCREILRDGKVVVRRPDAEELIAIRNGAWTYEQVVEEAERLDKESAELAEVSLLPKEPNRVWLDEWLVRWTEKELHDEFNPYDLTWGLACLEEETAP